MPADRSHPACPRCGYDLSGAVATWESRCPVEGRCTECGLVFLWRDVLRDDFGVIEHSIEHAPLGVRPLAKAAAVTLWRLLLPWKLWSRLRMGHNVVWHRLVIAIVLLSLAGHAALIGSRALTGLLDLDQEHRLRAYLLANQEAHSWYDPSKATPLPSWSQTVLKAASEAHIRHRRDVADSLGRETPTGFWLLLITPDSPGLLTAPIVATLFAVCGLALFRTIAKYRARRSHIVRAWLYALAGVASVGAFRLSLQSIHILAEDWSRGASYRGLWKYSLLWYEPVLELLSHIRPALAWLVEWLWVAWVVWLIVFWWFVFRRYLREPRWTYGFALLVVLVASLYAVLLILLGYPVDEWLLGNPLDRVP